MKKSLFVVFGVASLFSYAAFFAVIPASAQATPSATLSISSNGFPGFTFDVGQTWTLDVTSNLPGQNFSLCDIDNHGVQSCTPWAITNGAGNWIGTGTFAASAVGQWSEWVMFPSENVSSPHLSFTVIQPTATQTGGSTTATPTPVSTSPTNSTTCTSCTPSSALAALSAMISQLQSASALLATGNVSPAVMSNMENLISVAEQLLSQLTSGQGVPGTTTATTPTETTTITTTGALTGLSLNGSTTGSYTAGEPWTLNFNEGEPDTTFTICDIENGTQSCTPNWGTTDANGNYAQSGTFSSSDTGPWTEWLVFPDGTMSNQISFSLAGTAVSGATITFPVNVLVTAATLNVRSAANTSAPLAGSQTLSAGDEFVATSEVQGQSVNGNDLWWVSSDGYYIWSGGTIDEGSVVVNRGVTASSVAGSKSLLVNGTNYTVNYIYLPDGEVQADFTYKGQSLGARAINAVNGIYQEAVVQSDGTVVKPYFATTNGTQTGPADTNLTALVAQIFQNAPAAKTVYTGFTFSTPFYYVDDVSPYYVLNPANAYLITHAPASNVPVNLYYLTVGTSGTITSVQPINISTTGAVTTGAAIAVNAPNLTLPAPTLSPEQLATAIFQAVGFDAAIAVAKGAGYLVEVDNTSNLMTAIIRNPQTNAVVASVTQQ